MQLADDAIQELWTISDMTGVRPEYLAPVLYFESGFNPAAVNNASGASGLNQTMPSNLAAFGTTPASFRAMSQAQQLTTAVAPYFTTAVQTYGPIRSATRAYQANFLPATLATAKALTAIVILGGTSAYNANKVLDPFNHGAILVADLAYTMARAAASSECAAAIARAYQLRPGESQTNPVYGTDYADPLASFASAALLAWQSARSA